MHQEANRTNGRVQLRGRLTGAHHRKTGGATGVPGVPRRRQASEKKGEHDQRSHSSSRSQDLKLSAARHARSAGSCSSMHLRFAGEATHNRRGRPIIAVTRADHPTSDAHRRRRAALP